MRVFVVGTGRCGTRTFHQACLRISNFTAGHETHALRSIGDLEYPDGHIEVDHHLGWALPLLLERYPPGPEALYIHLLREREDCVRSFSRRRLVDVFAELCCFVRCSAETPIARRQAAEYYYDVRNRTIEALLGPESPSVYIEKLAAFWPWFWERIGAQGDYEAALAECSKRYNRGVPAKGETVRDEH